MWSTTSGAPRTRSGRGASRKGWPTAWLSACSAAALLAAGCGAERETIPEPTAESLAAQTDRVAEALAAGDPCEADRLADELVAEAETADLPDDYRPELLTAARSLADSVECPPAPAPPPPAADEDDDEKDEKDEKDDGGENGKGNGKGKGKGKGEKDDD